MYVGQLAEKRIRTIHLQRNPYVCTIPWSGVIVMKIVTGWSEQTPEQLSAYKTWKPLPG